MKKILTGTTATILVLSMVGCAQKRPEEPKVTEEPVATAEATPEATETPADAPAMIVQGAWLIQQNERIETKSDDAGRLARATEDKQYDLVDALAYREIDGGKEYMYLVYIPDEAKPGKVWAIADVHEMDTGEITLAGTTPIDLATMKYVNPDEKNIPEHPVGVNADWTFIDTGKSAEFTIEDFRITTEEVLAKNNSTYVPEVFLAESVTGNGYVILARDVDETSSLKDYHIIEVTRSGNVDPEHPEADEPDLTYDELVDFSKYVAEGATDTTVQPINETEVAVGATAEAAPAAN